MFDNEIKSRNDDQYNLNLYGETVLTQIADEWNEPVSEYNSDSYDSEDED